MSQQNEKTFSMPRESFDKWLTALRSGEYTLGRRVLRTTAGSYCCLGVLQKTLSGECENQPAITESWAGKHQLSLLQDNDSGGYWNPFLPSVPVEEGYNFTASCGYVNDALRMTFPQIADVLERHYKEPSNV